MAVVKPLGAGRPACPGRALPAGILALLAALGIVLAGGGSAAEARVIATPGPTARNASVYSEISFRGIKASHSGRITVRGSRSGTHGYAKRRHGDNRGFSLLLKRRLQPSENVRVSTRFRVWGARGKSYRFRTENVNLPRAGRMTPRARPYARVKGFVTRPRLKPPRMVIRKRSKQASDRRLFVASKGAGAGIYDADGQPVWFRPGRITDLRRRTWRGKPVLTWIESPTRGSGLKRNTYIIADTSYRIIRRLTPGNGLGADIHEFRLTNRGTAFVTAYRSRKRNLRAVGQSAHGRVLDSIAQEIELRTGRVLWEWHSLDHVPITDTYAEKPRAPGMPFDYFHINTVSGTPDGNVMISGRSTNTAYKVSRRTGRVMWRLGGRRSSFRMGRGARFSWQHDTELKPGYRFTVFDNGDSPVASKRWRKQSRGLVLKLNPKRMTARVLHSFYNPAKPLASTQGNLQSLPGGSYLVGWGGAPLISEHAGGGGMLFDARLTGIDAYYRAYRDSWWGKPAGRPALVARKTDEAGRTRLWVSHNGDTATRTWRVYAGEARGKLHHIADRDREGFETAVSLPFSSALVKVRGLDARGHPTGDSAVVRVDR